MNRVLIIGYGNPLRSDDGLGWHAAGILAQRFSERSDIQVMRCHQVTPDLAFDLSRADLVLFIDASRELTPGTVSCEAVGSSGKSSSCSFSHYMTPAKVLELCEQLYGVAPPAYLFAVGAVTCNEGEPLSSVVRGALESLITKIETLVFASTQP